MRFRHAWLVLFILSLVEIGVSFSYSVFGHSLEPQANSAVSRITSTSPSLGNFVSEMVRLIGLNWLTWGFLVAMISVTAYRRGEMWAWYTLWIVPLYFLGDSYVDFSAGGSGWPNGVLVAVVVAVLLLVSPQASNKRKGMDSDAAESSTRESIGES